jgi:hypothetical protein
MLKLVNFLINFLSEYQNCITKNALKPDKSMITAINGLNTFTKESQILIVQGL